MNNKTIKIKKILHLKISLVSRKIKPRGLLRTQCKSQTEPIKREKKNLRHIVGRSKSLCICAEAKNEENEG
jgi:hypothetical protein